MVRLGHLGWMLALAACGQIGFDGAGAGGDADPGADGATPASGRRYFIGKENVCRLDAAGGLECAGHADQFQLGLAPQRLDSATFVPHRSAPALQTVSAGDHFLCGIDLAGAARCWGDNSGGRLGTLSDGSTPLPVDEVAAAEAIATGNSHSCVVTGGQVLCWGFEEAGELGFGLRPLAPEGHPASPVPGLPAMAPAIDSEAQHTCALDQAGGVWCWGRNDAGQCGTGAVTTVAAPTRVGPDVIPAATAISVGATHTCALDGAGQIWCWGDNSSEQLGPGPGPGPAAAPVQVAVPFAATAVAAGYGATCAISPGGGVWCWGYNEDGQLGLDPPQYAALPAQVPGLSGITRLASSHGAICAGDAAGQGWCWGHNYYGQLGLGDGRLRHLAAQTVRSDVVELAAGQDHACAVGAGGELACWGANWDGQLGDGTEARRRAPVVIGTGYAGPTMGAYHTCARTGAGLVACWGDGGRGQLAGPTGASTPTLVSGLSISATAVRAGLLHTCALGGGAVWCWGDNSALQLGNGTAAMRATPEPVVGLTAASALAVGSLHGCAVTGAGAVACWGHGEAGQLGDGTSGNRAMAAPVLGLSGMVGVTAGANHTCAWTGGGEAWCWGHNGSGQLGDGSGMTRATPVRVATGVAQVVAGGDTTCVVNTDGSTACAGAGADGELGDLAQQDQVGFVPVRAVTAVSALALTYRRSFALAGNTLFGWGFDYAGELGTGGSGVEVAPAPVP
ncbi:MAG: hypothetical protein KA297_05720 [Kofleriaceae bacterium]|nr:hypothetical protein [Kofleriaceae bacterium]